ncbi:MAG: condensation domain-containing protein, partial [Actinocatenispora sp.]
MRTSPLSAFQTVYWDHDRRRPGSPAVILRAYDVIGPLDLDALTDAVAATTRRHESLRTRFVPGAGEPRQVTEPDVPVAVRTVDLRGLDPDGRAAGIREQEVRERHTPFDLGRAPLWRLTLLRLAEREHVLLLAAHHIVADGWSMSVLAADLSGGADTDRAGTG